MGAMDVCPFIPVQNVSMDDCVRCANVFGEKLADMLHVPGQSQPTMCEVVKLILALAKTKKTVAKEKELSKKLPWLAFWLIIPGIRPQFISTQKQREKNQGALSRLSEQESMKRCLIR